MNLERLPSEIVDCETGLKRFVGDRSLYEFVLSSFLEDTCLTRATSALERRDYEDLYESVHELKGLSGNASVTQVYAACSELSSLLHSKEYTLPQVEQLVASLKTACDAACEAIRLAGC